MNPKPFELTVTDRATTGVSVWPGRLVPRPTAPARSHEIYRHHSSPVKEGTGDRIWGHRPRPYRHMAGAARAQKRGFLGRAVGGTLARYCSPCVARQSHGTTLS